MQAYGVEDAAETEDDVTPACPPSGPTGQIELIA